MLATERKQAGGKSLKIPTLFFRDATFEDELLERYAAWQRCGTLCDTVIHINQKEFDCHKVLLASCSDFFLGLFTRADSKNFHLDELDAMSFEYLFHFMYSGQLNVPRPHVPAVYKLSKILKLKQVEKACVPFLLENITADNALEIRSACHRDRKEDMVLCDAVDQFLRENVQMLFVENKFTLPENLNRYHVKITMECQDELDNVNVGSLLPLVLDYLNCLHEKTDAKLDMAMNEALELFLTRQWNIIPNMTSDIGSENQDCVFINQGGYRSSGSLSTSGSSHSGSISSVDQETHVLAAMISETNSMTHCLGKIRGRLSLLMLTISNPSETSQQKKSPHSPNTEQHLPPDSYLATSNHHWKNSGRTGLAAMTTPRSACRAAMLTQSNGADRILVMGGYNRVNSCLSQCELFDSVHNSWSQVSCLPTPRSRFAIHHDRQYGLIFAVGGSGLNGILSSVDCYNESTEEWLLPGSCAPMPGQRCSHAVVRGLGSSQLGVIGGSIGPGSLADCHIYDYSSDQWMPMPPLNQARSECAACTHSNGVIYVYGGVTDALRGCVATGEWWDPRQPQGWQIMTELMPQERRGADLLPLSSEVCAAFFQAEKSLGGDCTVSPSEECLALIGGCDLRGSQRQSFIFETRMNKWFHGPLLNHARVNTASCLSQDGERVYTIGGFSGKHFLDSMEIWTPKLNAQWSLNC